MLRAVIDLATELIERRRRIDREELEWSCLAAAFAETREWRRDGSYSAIDWLRHNCDLSTGGAGDRLCVGRQVPELEASVEALRESRIGFGHLVKMARLKEAAGPRFDEPAMLEQAEQCSVGRFHHLCEQARHQADAEAMALEQAEQARRRWLELMPHEDGVVSVRGLLDSEGGAVVRNALEALARPAGAGDDRRHDRRLADALVELAAGARPPRLNVTVSLDTLLGRPGAPAGEMDFAPPISAASVQRYACDCTLTRVVMDADSVVIDVGRGRRLVNGPMRRALESRDGGCVWPGCERPARWCEPHHKVPWSAGGGTSVGESVLLCHRHHWMVHEGRWRLVFAERSGKVLAVHPPPPRTWNLPQVA